jgi:four helix bundle protein
VLFRSVYQAARDFRNDMYALAARLPDTEKFGLASQIRRAAVSLTNNIAEGHGRYHYLDQIKFMLQARGSLQELLDDLNVCHDQAYFPAAKVEPLKQKGWNVSRLLGGYIRFLRERKAEQNPAFRETQVDYSAAAINDGTSDDYSTM